LVSIATVCHKLVSRATALIRRSLGTTDLSLRLDAVERVLDERPRPAYLGDHTALLQTRWGGMLLIDTRDSVLGPALLLNGLWETEITKWFQDTLRPGHIFVDVGANVGYYTLLGSQLVGDGGHVFAIEAHPRMMELLHRNVIVNGRYNVETWHRAAWSRSETLKFHVRRHFIGNSSAGSLSDHGKELLDDDEDIVEVQAVTLDEILAESPRVDLIKVDVEGAELQVMTGLARTFSSNPDITVMFEWSPGQIEMVGDEPRALLDLMRKHGFNFRLMERALAPVSDSELLGVHHGNVVARRRS
jgi:FkbM family methyltransferase